MVSITGGCNKCGRLMESKAFDPITGEIPILVCNDCYNRYYSLEAQREQKLNKLLKKSIWKRLQSKLKL
jgi:hypothetical protein